jgi:hypothetical protein
MYIARFYQVTPAGYVSACASDNSPKRAMQAAIEKCEARYFELCRNTRQCLSVGVDGWSMRLNGRLIGRQDNF